MLRIKELRNKKNITQDELVSNISISKRSLGYYEKGEIEPKAEVLQEIANYLGCKVDDLFLKKQIESREVNESLPYYDIDATASQIEVFNDYAERPSYFMQLPTFTDCDFACNVSGDSMFPKFCSGDIILCKKINNVNLIQYGEPYLIVTNEKADNLRTIKILRKNRKDDSLITLKPSNPNFDEFEIQRDSIISLYLIKGKMNRGVM